MDLVAGTSPRGPRWAIPIAFCLSALAAAPARGQDVLDVMVPLDRAGQYATDYGAAFRPVIAQEHYEQAEWIRGAPRRWRKLESDFITLHVPEDDHWLGFRDVRAVDGRELRAKDRSRRLERLLSGHREMRRLRDALLVLDMSASVRGRKLGALRDAAGASLDGLSPVDRAALLGFQQSIR